MYNCSVITNVNLFFKWQKLNPKLQLRFKKNQQCPAQVFMLKLKHLALKPVNFIKKPIEGKVDKMAQSEKKRVEGKKPLSKKTKVKFGKRLKANYIVLNKLTN
jgi:hypothetical protein